MRRYCDKCGMPENHCLCSRSSRHDTDTVWYLAIFVLFLILVCR